MHMLIGVISALPLKEITDSVNKEAKLPTADRGARGLRFVGAPRGHTGGFYCKLKKVISVNIRIF